MSAPILFVRRELLPSCTITTLSLVGAKNLSPFGANVGGYFIGYGQMIIRPYGLRRGDF